MFSSPNIFLTYLSPGFARHLGTYNLGPSIIGLIFSIITFVYIISMPVIVYLCKYGNFRIWIIIGSLLEAISFVLLGPEKLIFP